MPARNDDDALRSLLQDVREGCEADAVDSSIGPYRLKKLLGKGGFGVVWEAEQTEPIKRRVALKLMTHSRNTDEIIARFKDERQKMADLNHPNIAKIYDASASNRKQPYFAMELIEGGVSITRYCDRKKLSLRDRLEMFIPVCEAIQHAHQKSIVHRDIKPDNVLISLDDETPIPKVIDFGIAKAIGRSLTEELRSTYGEHPGGEPNEVPVLGTLDYLSPEQTTHAVDTCSDIYALGGTLYELLTGMTPFEPIWLRSGGDREALRRIREIMPPKPSERLENLKACLLDLSEKRGTKPSKLLRQIQGDLDAIVMKCLAKEPSERYETASDLARDIKNYLHNEPVAAHDPPPKWYRLKKYHSRHPWRLPAAAAFILLLATGTVVSTTFAIRASENARQANSAEGEAKKAAEASRKAAMVVGSILQNLTLSAEEKGGASLREQLISNLREAKGQMERLVSEDRLTGARFGATLGYTLYGLGQTGEAIEVLESALAIFEAERGSDDLETLAVMSRLAASYLGEGNWEKAISLAERAFRMRRSQLGLDDADTLESMSLLAVSYYQSGQHDQAVSLLEQAFERAKIKLGPYHRRTLFIQSDLSLMYRDKGEPSKAVSLLEATLEKALDKFGVQYVTLQLVLNLADSYLESGRANEVVKDQGFEGDLDILKNNFGSDHSMTLQFLFRLIDAYQDSNQYEKGDRLLQEWLQDVRVRAGSESFPTAVLLFWRGFNLLKQKQFAKAEPFLRECLSVLDKKYPKDKDIFTVRMTLGEALLGQKKHSEAEPLLGKGYDGMVESERKLSLNDKLRLKRFLNGTLTRLVQLFEAMGQKDKADSWRKKLEERTASQKQPKS